MKPELTSKQKITQAVKEVEDAMLENLEVSILVVDTLKRKELAHYTLLKAKDRLRAIESEILANN